MLTIKPMTPHHKDAIRVLLEDTPEFNKVDVKIALELCDVYLDDLKDSGYYVKVGMSGSSLAGYFCTGPTPLTEGVWDLYWIAVNRSFRGKGYGRALLVAAEDMARSNKARMLLIETSSTPGYRAARGLYRSAGYNLIARVRDFYTMGDDKVLYRKDFPVQA